MFYIRFTETIEEDIIRNTSILTNHDNMIVEGLCAFYGENDLEKTMNKAKMYGRVVAEAGDTFAIIEGVETKGPTGTLGTVITNVRLISKHSL